MNNAEQIRQTAKLMQVAANRPDSKLAQAISCYYAEPGLNQIAELIAAIAEDETAAADMDAISLPYLIEEFLDWTDSQHWPRGKIMKLTADVLQHVVNIYGRQVDQQYEDTEQLVDNIMRSG